jgi:hypothetical protein
MDSALAWNLSLRFLSDSALSLISSPVALPTDLF